MLTIKNFEFNHNAFVLRGALSVKIVPFFHCHKEVSIYSANETKNCLLKSGKDIIQFTVFYAVSCISHCSWLYWQTQPATIVNAACCIF